MKKTVCILMIALIFTSLFCSCSNEPISLFDSGKTIKIGIVQFENNDEYTEAKDGFISRMSELGYDKKVNIDYKFANENEDALNKICQGFVSDKKDVIISIAPTATKAAMNAAHGEIPIFFMAVENPVSEQIMKSRTSLGTGVTGVTNYVTPDCIINFIMQDIKGGILEHLGIIYNTGEVKTTMDINDFKSYMNTNAIPYIESVISNEFEGQQAIAKLLSYIDPSFTNAMLMQGAEVNPEDIKMGVDAIYISGDDVSKRSLEYITETLEQSNATIYVANEGMLTSKKFACAKPVYEAIGTQTAEMADKYFKGLEFKYLFCEDPLYYYKKTLDTDENSESVEEISEEQEIEESANAKKESEAKKINAANAANAALNAVAE